MLLFLTGQLRRRTKVEQRDFLASYLADSGILFDQDFDAAGDGDGDDGAKEAEHVSADDHGDEDDDGAEVEGATLDFRREDVDFDEAVDDVKCEPDDGHEGVVED